ncbi:MAG: glutamine synthetase family protein [Acidimicrobiia bacterium]|nr:glutamine synthetase family protein [Acidimicrobiia bacterium]
MTPDELRASVTAGSIDPGSIDTVVMAFPDHYGRLMGKRFDAGFFLDEAIGGGTHACDYLFTVDMEMEPLEGFRYASWTLGFGDFHMVPDLSTLRRCAWADRTAMVLCDAHDNSNHEPVSVAPRSILRRQVERAAAQGFEVMAASELEFFLSRDSYREAHEKGYRDLESAGWYVEDYHLLQGARVEDYVGAARRALRDSEIPVETSKGEAATGQHELNVRYAEVLTMADRHVVLKQALKELADAQGVSVTFMAKPDAEQSGSSCHLHLSLRHLAGPDEGSGAFTDADGATTDVFRWFLGGWMHHAPDLMPCYAPTINSYKRFQHQSWAPTGLSWSHDNRTSGFRIVGSGDNLRIECRVPGADTNPYLAFAAALASGLDGIANQIEPPDELRGDAYTTDVQSLPTTLAAATGRFASSDAARRLLGDDVVEHYAHHFETECAAYDRAVTDWERRRYYERI